MVENAVDLRTILIPQRDTPYGQDVRIDVVPLTDQWLTSPERTWDEIDRALEGHLQGIQTHLSFENIPTHLARNYGLEHVPGGNAARFLAYVELFDEYSQECEFYLTKAKSAREAYENEKERIKRSSMKPSKVGRSLQSLWVNNYNPQVIKNKERTDELIKIKDLVVRKAVLDIFSVENNTTETGNPLVTEKFPKIVAEANELFDKNPNPLSEQFKQRRPIDQFLKSLTNYLTQTSDRDLFMRYSYRRSPCLITKLEDCRVLDTCLEQMLGPESITTSTSTQDLLSTLGKAYFAFLRRRLAANLRLGESNPYPHASLVYDIFTAALYRGRLAIVSNISNFVDTQFGDLMHSVAAREEFYLIAQKRTRISEGMYNVFNRHPEITSLDVYSLDTIDQLPAEAIQYLTENECRIYNALWAVSHFDKEQVQDPIKKSRAAQVVIDYIDKESRFKGEPSVTKEVLNSIRTFLMLLPRPPINRPRGIEIDLGNLMVGRMTFPDQKNVSIHDIISGLRHFANSSRRLDTQSISEVITSQYLIHLDLFWGGRLDPARVDRENNFLWNEILDNPLWFVSPRGDRYLRRSDPELEGLGIESITYNISRERPREHSATVRLMELELPLQFWLDTDRKLLNGIHMLLLADKEPQNFFTNLLLKRLYLITSSLLSTDQEEGYGESEGTRILNYKRAHYRFLTSTVGRPITMESHGAQAHAKEIKEDYGIDIFAEIKRRRAIGTLRPDQYLTFVREVTPRIVSATVMPNDLKYRPELVHVP